MGGGERYFAELSLALSRRDDIVVSAFAADGPRVLRLRSGKWSGVPWREVVRAIRGADAVHVHQVNSRVFDAALAICGFLRKPLVLTDHGGGWYTLGRLLPRTRLRGVSALAAVSRASLEDLAWALNRPHEILYGGGDHILRSDSTAVRIDRRGSDFLFVGRLLPHKGIHLLIEALPPGRSLTVCGPSNLPDYLQLLRVAAAGKDIRFIIAISDEQLRGLYETTSYTVLPSVHDAFGRHYRRPELLGLTLLESASLGIPCVGSGLGGSAEVLEMLGMPTWEGATDPAIIERFLSQLPPARSVAYRQLKNTVHTGSKQFAWDAVAARCMRVYERLLSADHDASGVLR